MLSPHGPVDRDVVRPYDDRDNDAVVARKNRVFDRILRIPAGEYRLAYRSDGSHSFGDWNMSPPDDRYNYGVTIFRR